MTPRQRIEAVYHGQLPDQVPYMLDLSHWFYHRNQLTWDLSVSYEQPERDLIDYHKRVGAGFYMPNLGFFFEVNYPEDVKITTEKSDDGREIVWRIQTPLGTIQRSRIWEQSSYSWAISDWSIRDEQQLKVLGYALANRTYVPHWDRYQAWVDYVGDMGLVYLQAGYSAMGHLLCYWMGIEGTMYAVVDWHETVREVIDQINQNWLTLINLLACSPAQIIFLGDNFSSDIQPPHFFDEWSRSYYTEAIRRLHAADKFVAVHIDGRLSGALEMIACTGADCADAVTPAPFGDLTPEQCRDEAGPDFILSGGVPPDLWLLHMSTEYFKEAILRWLNLKKRSPRLIANAGDQVPPGAVEDRIVTMRDLVEQYGRYERV